MTLVRSNDRLAIKCFRTDLLLLYISCILLSVISLACYSSGQIVLSYIFSGIFILLSVFQPKERAIIFVLFGISNSAVLGIAGVSASVCVCAITSLRYLFKVRKVNVPFMAILLFYLMFSMNYYFRFSDISYGLIFPLKNALVLLFFYLLFSDNLFIENRKNIIIASIVLCALGIIANAVASSLLVDNGGRIHVLHNDSNILAIESMVVLSFCFILCFNNKALSKWFLLFISLVLTGIAFLTGSRAGLVLIVACYTLTVLLNISKPSHILLLLLVSIFGITFIMLSDVGKSAISLLKYRIETYEIIGDFSNGRIGIWKEYISAFNSSRRNWLLGFGNYSNAGITEMAHNGLLEDLTSNGLIGLLLLLVCYIQIIRELLKKTSINSNKMSVVKRAFTFLPLLLIFIGTLTLRGITNIINTPLLFVSIVLLTLNNDRRKETYD